MVRLNLQEHLIDRNSPDRRPRRAAYALPMLFTAGNVFLGFLAILKSFQGALLGENRAPGLQSGFRDWPPSPSAWRCCWTVWTGALPG